MSTNQMSEQVDEKPPLSFLEFLEQLLIPTGQLVEFTLMCFKGPRESQQFELLAQRFFEPLGLACAFYATSKSDAQKRALLNEILEIRTGLVEFHGGWNVQAKRAIAKLYCGQTKWCSSVKASAEKKSGRLLQSTNACTRILEVIEYHPSTRNIWLNCYLRASSPLFSKGKLNKWRTLVRYVNWGPSLSAIGFLDRVTSESCNFNRFTGPKGKAMVGKAAAVELLNRLSNSQAEVVHDGTMGESLVPHGSKVQTTLEGMLEVSAEFQPKSVIPVDYLKSLKDKRAIETRTFLKLSDLNGLLGAVQEAEAWLNKQVESLNDTVSLIAESLEKEKRIKTLEKLKKDFSEEEINLIKDSLK